MNGYGFGNLAVSAHDLAMFFYDSFGTNDILSSETQYLMTYDDFEPLTNLGNIQYGLGIINMNWFGLLPGQP